MKKDNENIKKYKVMILSSFYLFELFKQKALSNRKGFLIIFNELCSLHLLDCAYA